MFMSSYNTHFTINALKNHRFTNAAFLADKITILLSHIVKNIRNMFKAILEL